MNRGRIFAPKAAHSARHLPRQSATLQPQQQQRDRTEAMQMRQRIVKVARRLGLVLGVRSRSTAEESLVIRSSLRKSPAAANGAKASAAAAKCKKTVRFEDAKPKSASSSSKKMVKRTLSKACRYVSLGALCSSPVLLTSYPTEPNMATSHRSSWSAWTEPVTWCHSAQFM